MSKETSNDQKKNEYSEYNKRAYEKPLLISLNPGSNTIGQMVFSFQTFEGGSFPTTHGPS